MPCHVGSSCCAEPPCQRTGRWARPRNKLVDMRVSAPRRRFITDSEHIGRMRRRRASLRRPKAWRPLETHSGLRLDRHPPVEARYLAAGAGEAQNPVGPHEVAGARDVDCLRRKQERRYQSKASAPAASTDAIPKGASPLAAGGSCLLVSCLSATPCRPPRASATCRPPPPG